ncbi:MAG TPA: 50S ribosomal protein L23 [Aggregatilineales bacterium]|nr:50S ribosomal protein L23 [Aggregatilineales bacterium]HQA69372.1 50S ribosomal protein L23 [Aggregatilineales bacterium]
MGGYNLHLYDVLRRPVITEKSTRLTDENNVYVFEVDLRANKAQIAEAVETIFDVDVVKVNTAVMPAKMGRRLRKRYIRKKEWKKAYVTVAPGQSIELFGV